ncbi:MAG: hypothetical protein CMJ80_07160 [Planctomycetaceae bacterium]|nr:hypothetical protein [Planctomycetaceae bacterium]
MHSAFLPRGRFSIVTCLLTVSLCSIANGETAQVDYRRDIQPILAEHCLQCHGPDEDSLQAGLRLDVATATSEPADSGDVAIIAGRPSESILIDRITAHDPDLRMPPPDQDKPLSPAQIATIKQWIKQGAEYSTHWAFEPPTQPTVPKVDSDVKLHHAIDHFVSHRLGAEGLHRSPMADLHVLCRRIYLDLIGLPPSPVDITAFVKASQNDQQLAIRELVNELLDNEHFGEKWALPWLDVARYADSNGYEKDLPREQWAWRDWVIHAINRDLPYDEFIVQQIAGDLLPQSSQDQRVATGFLRNGMINEEGAIIPEEFRMEGMFDRMDAIGKSVLGMSLQCAQCHTHKFDPITQTEYYGMFAFLNNTYDAQSWVYTDEQLHQIDQLHSQLNQLEQQIKRQLPDWSDRLKAWTTAQNQRQSAVEWQVLQATDLHCKSELNHPTTLPDESILTLGHPTSSDDLYMTTEPKIEGVRGLRLEILTHGDLPFHGPGRSYLGTWALTELIVETRSTGDETWQAHPLVDATADFSEPDHALESIWNGGKPDKKRVCGPVSYLIDGKDETAWRADRGAGQRNTASVAVARFASPLNVTDGQQLRITLRTKHSGGGRKNAMIGRFRVSLTTSPEVVADATAYEAVLALKTPAAKRTSLQQEALFSAWRVTEPSIEKLNHEIKAVWATFPEASTSVLNLEERKPEDSRITHRLNRGVWNQPQDTVTAHVPAALHSFPEHAPRHRLTFAQWLADEKSPLTARVQVNRVWQAIFGTGLVDTPEDFGTRAEMPVYPEILDWLAVDFMQHNWSLKHLVGTIVSSATYQQTSHASPDALARDPRNRMLARGPRFRASAEVVRDIALTASGLLHRDVGGPSIFPPVPQSVLDYNYNKLDYWDVAPAPERYRRSSYLFRQRSMPNPSLTSFDAPNADFACARRSRSNTPLAALVSLNEPVFVESARAMAIRILREGGPTEVARADYAIRLVTGRPSRPAERNAIVALISDRRTQLADGWLSINEIATGDPGKRPDMPPETTPQDAAAWTIAARVLLNLDETVSKN